MITSYVGVFLIVLSLYLIRRARVARERELLVLREEMAKGKAKFVKGMELPDEKKMAEAGNRAWVSALEAQKRPTYKETT